MSIWDKFRPKAAKSEPDAAETEQIMTGPLESQLNRLEFRARPEFQSALKQQLQTRLVAQGAPSKPEKRGPARPNLGRPLPIALGFGGLAAIAIVLVSVLSVGLNSPPTPDINLPEANLRQLEGAVTPLAMTASPNSPAVGGIFRLYNTTTQKYIAPDEAEKTLGFEVRGPEYVPAGYQLQYAALQAPTEKRNNGSSMEANGYQLRYVGSGANNAPKSVKDSDYELEVYGWRVPFELKVAGLPPSPPLTPGQARPAPFNRLPSVIGAAKSASQDVQGTPGYLIEGAKWRINIIAQPSGSAEGPNFNGLAPQISPSGPPSRISAEQMRNRLASRVSFGKFMPAQAFYFIDYARLEPGKRPDTKGPKALVWQQGDLLRLVIGGENLGEDELRQVAESLKTVK